MVFGLLFPFVMEDWVNVRSYVSDSQILFKFSFSFHVCTVLGLKSPSLFLTADVNFPSFPQGLKSPFKYFGFEDGVSHVEARYPAILFKQQLTACVEKIFGLIRDNLKKELSPLLGSCIQVKFHFRLIWCYLFLNNPFFFWFSLFL